MSDDELMNLPVETLAKMVHVAAIKASGAERAAHEQYRVSLEAGDNANERRHREAQERYQRNHEEFMECERAKVNVLLEIRDAVVDSRG